MVFSMNARETYLRGIMECLAGCGYNYVRSRSFWIVNDTETGERRLWTGVPNSITEVLRELEMSGGKERLAAEAKYHYDHVLDEVQASIILSGGRRIDVAEIERMTVEELLSLIIPNGIDVLVHPNPKHFRKPRGQHG
jgi:hypothetical protein